MSVSAGSMKRQALVCPYRGMSLRASRRLVWRSTLIFTVRVVKLPSNKPVEFALSGSDLVDVARHSTAHRKRYADMTGHRECLARKYPSGQGVYREK